MFQVLSNAREHLAATVSFTATAAPNIFGSNGGLVEYFVDPQVLSHGLRQEKVLEAFEVFDSSRRASRRSRRPAGVR